MDNPLIGLETFLKSPTIKYILQQRTEKLRKNENLSEAEFPEQSSIDDQLSARLLQFEECMRFHGAHLIHQACRILNL